MPYVKSEVRTDLFFGAVRPKTPGELNYMFSQVAANYWNDLAVPKSYQRLNDIIGALEGAKLEFYRRVAGPYEDIKIKENGDVY